MARLPVPGGDSGAWGDILNEYLLTAHDAQGQLKPSTVDSSSIQSSSIDESKISTTNTPSVGQVLRYNGSALTWSTLSVGETNTASNVNTTGVGVFAQKSGVDLQFRGVAAGSSKVSATLNATNNTADIDVNEANFTNIPLASAVSGTLPLANGGTGATTQAAAANAILPTQSSQSGKFLTTNGTDASWSPLPVAQSRAPYVFVSTGVLIVEPGVNRLYNDTGQTLTITSIRASVVAAPTGSSLIVDVNIDGTTIFTTQANRPTIAISGVTSGKVTNMDVTSLPDGSYLTVDIDQIGSTYPGSNLTVQIQAVG